MVTVIASNGDGKSISQGTGFFISTNGTLITNGHVIRGAGKVSIKTKSGKLYNIAETIAEDVDGDLVVLRADTRADRVRPLRLSRTTVGIVNLTPGRSKNRNGDKIKPLLDIGSIYDHCD